MPTESGGNHDERPLNGPVTEGCDRYRYVKTEGETLIYDADREDAWIQASESVDLEAWR